MSITSETTRIVYNGDGATAAFTTPPYYAQADLKVYEVISGTATLRTIGSHYSVSPTSNANGSPAAGTVTFVTAFIPASGTSNVIIERDLAATQSSTVTDTGPFPGKTLEASMDRVMMVAQQVKNKVARGRRIPLG